MERSPGIFTDTKLPKYGRKSIFLILYIWFYCNFDRGSTTVCRVWIIINIHGLRGRLSRWRGDGIGTSVKINTWNEGFASTRRFRDFASFIRQPKWIEGFLKDDFCRPGVHFKRVRWNLNLDATDLGGFRFSKIKPFEWWTIGCEHQPEHHWNDFFKY